MSNVEDHPKPGEFIPLTRYEICAASYPVAKYAELNQFIDNVNTAIRRGGRVVQWLQSSVPGDPAAGGMMTQITAIVEFDR